MLPPVPEAAETAAAYELAIGSLQQYVAHVHMEWFETIDTSLAKELDAKLLLQVKFLSRRMHE